jgi:hypothetical protein
MKILATSDLRKQIHTFQSRNNRYPDREIVQNKPSSRIGAGDLRSRTLYVDMHAELHAIENH